MSDFGTQITAFLEEANLTFNGNIITFDKDLYTQDDQLDLERALYNQVYKRRRPESNDSTLSVDLREKLWETIQEVYPQTVSELWLIDDYLPEKSILIIKRGYNEQLISTDNAILFNQTHLIIKDELINLPHRLCIYDPSKDIVFIMGRVYPTLNNDELVRFYFNFDFNFDKNLITVFQNFIKTILIELNQRTISFKIKVLVNIKDYRYADAVVLYVEKIHYVASLNALSQIYEMFKRFFVKETPFFTYQIADGWGFAEEPKTDDDTLSFGTFRVKLLVDFIFENLSAIPLNTSTIEWIGEKFGEKLSKEDYDLTNFHLNPHTSLPQKTPQPTRFVYFPSFQSEDFKLNAAIKIGYLICKQAIWHNKDKCTWLYGKINPEANRNITTVTTCNGSFFDGTAGVGLFLYKLYQVYPDIVFRDTAMGAFMSAISTQEKGFYKGKLGVAYLILKLGLEESFRCFIDEIIQNFELDNSADTLLGYIYLNKVAHDTNIRKGLEDNGEIILKCIESADKYDFFITLAIAEYSYFLVDVPQSPEIELVKKVLEWINTGITNSEEFGWEKGKLGFSFIVERVLFNSLPSINEQLDADLKSLQTDLMQSIYEKWITEHNQPAIEDHSYSEGILGRVHFILDHSKGKNLQVENYAHRLYDKYLKYDLIPPFQTKNEFYNFGLFDGLSGLGYFYLRLLNEKNFDRLPFLGSRI